MRIGNFLFKYRSFIPAPLFILLIIFFRGVPLTFIIGIILSLIGIILRIFIQEYTGDWMRGNKVSGEFLLKEGPYNIIRHPFYLANFFVGTGIFIIPNFYLIITLPIFFLIFFLYYYFIIIEEEKYLKEKFDGEFEEYRKKVPAIIPRNLALKGSRRRGFKDALKMESSTILTISIVILIYAGRYFWKH
uniref:Isoprenylcysteine carboxylmethyltransferase family protein n=1 Tax=candidate division WOR-3 bacterium TaxID=2052148 RepID=A0A7C4YIT8_UNCW3